MSQCVAKTSFCATSSKPKPCRGTERLPWTPDCKGPLSQFSSDPSDDEGSSHSQVQDGLAEAELWLHSWMQFDKSLGCQCHHYHLTMLYFYAFSYDCLLVAKDRTPQNIQSFKWTNRYPPLGPSSRHQAKPCNGYGTSWCRARRNRSSDTCMLQTNQRDVCFGN